MSHSYAFGFSLFLIILVIFNIYLFYSLSAVDKSLNYFNLSAVRSNSVIEEIYDYLFHLPVKFKSKNSYFIFLQKSLISSFNYSVQHGPVFSWKETENWNSDSSLFPFKDGASGQILHAMQQATISFADNAPKGTQLKLMFVIEDKKILYFKPKRYDLNHVIHGNIYAGFDRHNSEVFAYYLAMTLNFTWVAPAAIRRIHIQRDVAPVATPGLLKTIVKKNSGSPCIYGNCFYCKANETVCPDPNGELEGAVILYFNKPFRIYKNPWRRSYNSKKMTWETDNNFCKKIAGTGVKRILNLIDIAIFDFLIQNGDRHHYEVYKDKIVLLDNGKGLGNPNFDEMDILAPLYQCCQISASTWQRLELVAGGSLTDVIKVLASFQKVTLATEEHFRAVERRLLKVYATVQYCFGKYGSAKVVKIGF